MKQTKQPERDFKADLILCADMHLRETVPKCRTDDYLTEQERKLDFISELQKKHDCPVVCAGDLFDHWKPSPELLTKASIHLPNRLIVPPGQHDLSNHNFDLLYKSGLWNLVVNERINNAFQIKVPDGEFKYGYIEIFFPNRITDRLVLIAHHTVWHEEKPFPELGKESNAITFLKKHPQYSLVVTGDNHLPFVAEYEGRLLVNPGSMMRMAADQIEHKPRVYLWNAEKNTVKAVYLPISEGMISREHIDIKERRQSQLDAFVASIREGNWGEEISFEKNLESFFQENGVKESIQNKVWEAVQ